MRFHFRLALLFLVLGSLDSPCSTSARVVVLAADHFHLNKGAWVHRRGLLDGIVDIASSSSPSTDTVTPSDPPGTTSALPPTSLGSDPPPSPTPTPTPTPSPSPGLLGLISGDSSTSASTPSSTPSGGLLPVLDDLLHPGPSSSTPPDPSSPALSDPAPSSTSSTDAGLLPILTPLLSPSSSDSGTIPPTLSPSSDSGGISPTLTPSSPDSGGIPSPTLTPSSSDSGGILPILTPILSPSSSDSGAIPPMVTPIPSSSDSGGILPILTPILGPSSSDSGAIPPMMTPIPSSSDSGGIPPIVTPIPSSSDSGGILPVPTPTSNPSSSDPGGILPILTPILGPSSSDTGGGQTSAIPPTSVLPLPLPATSSDPLPPPPPSDSPSISLASPSSPILPLPGSSSDALPSQSPPPDPPLTVAHLLPSTTPPPPPPSSPPPSPPPASPTPSSSISVNSDLSFVLTESSLAVASLPTSTDPGATGGTMTDPDAATTTVTNTQPSVNPSPSSAFASGSNSDPSKANSPQPPLPSGVPSRIYPASPQVPSGVTQADMEKEGYTLISLLFDQQLNWPFIIKSPIASSQVFAFSPALIATAIDESIDTVKTLFLQVFVPMSYTSPADQLDLGTIFYGYIPTDKVDTLEAMIKAKQSKFYTGISNPAAQQLAARVRSGWGVRGGPGDESSSSGGSSGGTGSGTTANQQKARRDAIVGVVSSLGAIAVLVLIVLIVHSMKRKRELAHRRLADQTSSLGSSGEDVGGAAVSGGREFDRDSVGAPRRRSFYFAEDSLRGWEAERDQDRDLNELGGRSPSSGGAMSQRRVGPVVLPGSISAPILRESSMNW